MKPVPETSRAARDALREYALLAPRLVKLVSRLMRDERVPVRSKALLVVVAAYLVAPVDVVPDFIPGGGYLDDLVVAAFALDQILNRVPEEVVLKHWDGDENLLQLVRAVLDLSVGLIPAPLRRRLPFV